MKKEEKVGIGILICIIILATVILIVKNNKNENVEKGNIIEKEKFVTILEDGTKLNISSKLHETKDFEGMEIMNLQLTENNNTTLLLGEITNTSPNVQGGYLVNIVIIDEQGNEMTTIEAYIKELNPGQSTQLSSKTTLDYANAYDISISRK